MTSTPSARLSAHWPLAAGSSEASTPVALSANAPLGALSFIGDTLRVMGAFAFGTRATRQSSTAMCELMDRLN